jgi:hypothetical protein
MRPTDEEIRERELVEHPLAERMPDGGPPRWEVWRCSHEREAYADQTGLKHGGYVVYERIIVEAYARAEQYEGYGGTWHMSDFWVVETSGDKRRRFRRRQELVDYSGGASYSELDSDLKSRAQAARAAMDSGDEALIAFLRPEPYEGKGLWQRKPWIGDDGLAKGYVTPDGQAVRQLDPDLRY